MRAVAFAVLIASSVLLTAPVAAAELDENAIVKQIAHSMTASELAVACGLRTPAWRKPVIMGWFAMVRLALMSVHMRATDDDLDAGAMEILKAAKVQAALDAQFAAPTKAQCDTLNASHDLKELDSAAQLGLMSGAVNNQ
jgi:hypothetical protein